MTYSSNSNQLYADIYQTYDGFWGGSTAIKTATIEYKLNCNFKSYVGEVSGQQPSGTGIMTYKNGDVYNGNWNNGKTNGEGVMTCINGDVFTGKFFVGSWAEGTMKYNDGTIYEGNNIKFETYDESRGKKNGPGKLTENTGNVIYGLWKDDKLTNEVTQEYWVNTLFK